MERFGRVFDGINLNLVDITGEAPSSRNDADELFPASLWHLAKSRAHGKVAITLSGVLESGVECAKFAEFAVDGKAGRGFYGRTGRVCREASLAAFRTE